jgi:hypothetical protein
MTEGNQRDENFEQLTNLSDKDIEQLWNHEALRRNAELDSGSASMRDAGDVFRDARSNLGKGSYIATKSTCYNSDEMLHRHLNHSDWTLAAIDDVIARGRLDDWKELRDVAAIRSDVRERILRVAEPHLSDPYAQRYHFWNLYVRKQLA